MLCIHTPALLKYWRVILHGTVSDAQLAGCLWLTLAVAFFLLKLLDPRCLRFQTSARALLTTAVAVLLMHGKTAGLPTYTLALPGDVPLITSSLFAMGLQRVQGLISVLLAAGRRRASRPPVVWAPVRGAAPTPCCWRPLPSRAPRPPPALA
jgi:hypothetical protein